ncbi:MAG TPA: hypothetical protein VGB32_03730 [Candidatus Bathyarchaeia archaeon]
MGSPLSLRALITALGLMVRAPGWAYQWSRGYRRARGAFRRQLVASGIPPEEARELSEMYPFKMGDLIEAARGV